MTFTPTSSRNTAGTPRVLMLLENNPYPKDTRVRKEAYSLRDAGYHVSVIAPRADGQPSRELVDGIEVERFSLSGETSSRLAFVKEYLVANLHLHLRAVRRIGRFDILHLHNPPDTLFPVAFLARLFRRRVIFDQHDLAPELFLERFGPGILLRLLTAFERMTYRVADAVLVVNDSLRQIALTRGALLEGQVFVVRNAPPQAMFSAPTPARPGLLTDPHLIYVGSLGPQDGVDDLPPLMRTLRGEHGLSGARLTIVGDGERLAPLQQAFAADGLADAVTFTGYLPQEDVAAVLHQADICLEPARCNDHNQRCSMVKVYEYMAAGRPIVSYRLREVELLGGDEITYAECNDMADYAGRVAELAGDAEQRLASGHRLQKRAQARSWETEAQQLLAAYTYAQQRPTAQGVG